MIKKPTDELMKELLCSNNIDRYIKENEQHFVDLTISEFLNEYVKAKNLVKSQIFKNSEMNDIYGYQIFSGVRVPERKKLLCLAVSMGLNIEEVQQLLKCAGYSQLYAKLPFDSVVMYGLCKKMSVVQINELLFEYGLETLG